LGIVEKFDNWGGIEMIVSGDKHIPMNVSAAADAGFMRELQRSDPERYQRLIRNMEKSLGAQKSLSNAA
jgi:hypothetical protein